jgi:hypothetical protein
MSAKVAGVLEKSKRFDFSRTRRTTTARLLYFSLEVLQFVSPRRVLQLLFSCCSADPSTSYVSKFRVQLETWDMEKFEPLFTGLFEQTFKKLLFKHPLAIL